MTKPLAVIIFENLLLGNQLFNRLQDLGYRVTAMTANTASDQKLAEIKPLLVILDLTSKKFDALDFLKAVRQNSATSHIPVLAFAPETQKELQTGAADRGATLVASETAILEQLPTLLDRILQID